MGDNTNLKLILIITCAIFGLVSLGFFVWTIYIYNKNKKYLKEAKEHVDYSPGLFYTALGGRKNVLNYEFKGIYIRFSLQNLDIIIIDFIKTLPNLQKYEINKSENSIDLYLNNADKIYEMLMNEVKSS